ncbi:MAG: phytanoyl-CoA dioxygenase family protein [Pseudomonadota bacterium]
MATQPVSNLDALAVSYARDGFLSPVPILSAEEAAAHRVELEHVEQQLGVLHYKNKVHTIWPAAFALATHPRVLDVVESLLGPDILLHNTCYIIKEAETHAHVSWHQDLTHWGFDGGDQVSLWLAITPATAESGCMRMVPGSHAGGQMHHDSVADTSNLLLRGQTVRDVAENTARLCPLAPGEASFHHGWTLHASLPNHAKARRIGLNAQYLTPSMRQTKHDTDSAILVRGCDRHRHFATELPAIATLEAGAVSRWRAMDQQYQDTQTTG